MGFAVVDGAAPGQADVSVEKEAMGGRNLGTQIDHQAGLFFFGGVGQLDVVAETRGTLLGTPGDVPIDFGEGDPAQTSRTEMELSMESLTGPV